MDDQILGIRHEDRVNYKGSDTWHEMVEVQVDYGELDTWHMMKVLISHRRSDIRQVWEVLTGYGGSDVKYMDESLNILWRIIY